MQITAPIFIKIDEGQELSAHDTRMLQRAANIYEGLVKFKPDHGVYFALGQVYQKAGENQKAVDRLRQYLELVPKSDEWRLQIADANFMLSRAYFDLGKYEEALIAIEPAIKAYPEAPNYLLTRARAFLQLNRNAEAKKDLQLTLKLDPENRFAKALLKLIND